MTSLLQVRQAAEILGVHESTLRRWADDGRLPAVRLPSGVRRFRPEDVGKLRQGMYEAVAQDEVSAVATI
jgi:excisionase family DNA binding protein